MSAELDFVVYLGDPDDGAEALPGSTIAAAIDEHKDKLGLPDAYGAVVVKRGAEEVSDRRPDPIVPLIAKFVRTVPYIIEGEAETILLSESEHGYMLEASGDDVFLSFFAGDPYEPDEYLVEQTSVHLKEIGAQILKMGETMLTILKAASPESFEDDGEGQHLEEFLEIGKEAFKTYKLELERGLRVQ